MEPQFVDVASLATLLGTVLVILIFTSLFKEVLKGFGVEKPGTHAPLLAVIVGVVVQVSVTLSAKGVEPIALLLAFINGCIAAYAAMKTYESHFETETET